MKIILRLLRAVAHKLKRVLVFCALFSVDRRRAMYYAHHDED